MSSDKDRLEQFGRENRVGVKSIGLSRTISPWTDLKCIWVSYRYFKKVRPTIVHSHTPKAGFVGMTAAYLAGVPIRLHTVAGLPLMESRGFKRWILKRVEGFTYRMATEVYCNSEGLRQYMSEEGLRNESKVKIIANGSSNGIDIRYFSPANYSEEKIAQIRKDLGIPESAMVYVFVGRMVKDKGINELIKAFTELQGSRPDCFLLLVGPFESELDPLLPETLQTLETHAKIIHLGFQKDVRPYLACSDALVFPSYREGFPNVVMQAGAMGLPSIVSDINGCNEIIGDEINGLLVPAKDSTALRKAMLRLLDNQELTGSLAGVAREMISSRFERRMVWEELASEYKRLLSKL